MLSACSGQNANSDENDMKVRALTSNMQCGAAKNASLVEINSSQDLNTYLRSQPPADAAMLKHERVFMINMGMRGTAGYSLDLAQPPARLEGQVLTISIVWREPAPGSMVAQVITQPCLIVAVKKDKYREVRAVDQNGVERARLAL